MSKLSFYLACLVMLFALGTRVQAAKPFQQDAGADGLVSIEAEHYDNKVDKGSNTWSLVTTAAGFTAPEGFSGGQAMQIMPDTPLGGRSISSNWVANSPRLDFQVNFVKTGVYNVWILAFGRDGNADSAHAGLDGLALDTCDNLSGWNALWRWRNTGMDGSLSTIEVTTIGVHTLNLYMREDGLAFDKVVLTLNASYTPTGHGPAESPRGIPAYAIGASPADGAGDIPRDVTLSWQPAPSAAQHDVYFGTVLADVENAGRANPLGVLVGQAQDANTYDPPERLEFGTTYYWRVDEVNAPPDSTISKGKIWSFTTEPFIYRVTTITATASSSTEGVTPQNTVNGSGLTTGDVHSMADNAMWLSAKGGPQPTWIQYEFDGVYKLDEMWVWNYNVMVESTLGFGIKDVTVEYSANGTDWTSLGDRQFTQGPAQDGYAHDTTVHFDGVAAKYVRLTAKSNWRNLEVQYGLSEVRFYYTPAHPREPQPASGKTGVSPAVILSWRAGREAASHEIYFSDSNEAVASGTALAATVDENSYDPAALGIQLGTTYYWKVVEVNQAATPSAWEGDVWSFSTQQLFVVDDFEGYTNDSPNRVFQAWIDGWGFSKDTFFPDGNPGNGTGALVGYDPESGNIMETAIIHGGKQAMPVEYNNVNQPYYSEVERTWQTPQDLTAHGADILQLFFRGNPIGFEEKAGVITMSAAGADIFAAADEFTYAYKLLNGNGSLTVRIDSVENTNVWAKAGVMIRDNLGADAKNAMAYVTPDGRVGWQFRQLPVGTSDSTRSEPGAITLPHWVRLTREGNTITAAHSSDGIKWEPMVEAANPAEPSSLAIPMNTNIFIGLALTSHAAGVGCTAQFSSAATTGGATGPWQFAEIGVDHLLNERGNLYVALQDSAGHTGVVTHANPDAVLLDTWQEWNIPLADFRSAGVNVAAVKKMFIGVGDRKKPTAGGAGTLFIDDIGFGRPVSGQ